MKLSAEQQKKVLYVFLVAGLFFLYVTYVPYLLDYYIIRPERGIGAFLFDNPDIVNYHYDFEAVIIGLGLVGIYCLTQNAGVSVLVVSVFLFVLTHASYLKYINRRELLRLNDLKLTEVAGMALGQVRFRADAYLGVLAGGLILLTAMGFLERLLWRKPLFRKWVLRIVACVGCLVVGIGYTKYHFYGKLSLDSVETFRVTDTESNKYVLYRFLENDSLSTDGVEQVEEVYANLLAQAPDRETGTDGIRPNIIVIMNESWWNTDNIASDRVTFSMDPMQPYKDLASKCTLGYMTSNVYGGGTVSSESEFLTGLDTKYFVHDSTVYSDTAGRKLPSVVDYLHALGYNTTAIHPYFPEIYSRDQAYRQFGFDKVIFDGDMDYRDIYTKYISDESLAKQIILEYERAKAGEAQGAGQENAAPANGGQTYEPQFIWALSMANHTRIMEYTHEAVEDYPYPISVEIRDNHLSEDDYKTLVNYVNGFYLAEQAYAQLVEYFEQQDEPTVILMYGDHIPNFSEDVLEVLGLSMTDYSLEMVSRMQSIPLVLWSNYAPEKVAKIQFSGEGIYYLPEALFRNLEMPDTNMMRILRLQRTAFKANARTFVTDAEGELLKQCTEEQMHILNQSKVVQYDLMFGEQKCMDVWEPIGE